MVRAAASGGSWWVLGGLAALVVGQSVAGCEPETGGLDPSLGADQLLRDVGPHVVRPALARFDEALSDAELAVEAWAESGDAADREGVEDAFFAVSEVWQELEVMQVGPAASSLVDPAGIDLRDEVYSWPTVNPCRVDMITAEAGWSDASFFQGNLVNVYGLDALEHVVFGEADNACPSQVGIDADWDALGSSGVAQARADYALVLVAGMREVAAELIDAWSTDGGDFGATLASGDASPYGSELRAVNAVFDAMFYLETMTKDRKLAEPLGLGTCDGACDELAEATKSGQSVPFVAANLRGFRAVFTGGEGRGFDELLTDAGHADLSDRILTNLEAALALAEQPEKGLDQELYDAVKRVTDDLKGDVATVLTLRLPLAAAGDND